VVGGGGREGGGAERSEVGLKFLKDTASQFPRVRARARVRARVADSISAQLADVACNKTHRDIRDTPRFHVTARESDVLSMHYQ